MPETEPKITYKLRNIYRYIAKHLTWSRKKRLATNDYGLELFPKDITICLQGCKYRRTFGYSRVLNMPLIMIMSAFRR